MKCANCNAEGAALNGDSYCAPCVQAGINHGYERATLTRGEALALIDEIMQVHGPVLDMLQDLATHWIGHSEHGYSDSEEYAEFLRDYVAECCVSDNTRSNGNSDEDDTGLTDPDEPGGPTPEQRARNVIENQLTTLSDMLRQWCASQGLPFMCADELRATQRVSAPQREWLDAFCTLWDLTNKGAK